MVKTLPGVQETQDMQFLSLGQKDPLEEAMGIHANILARRISRTGETGGLQSMGLRRVRHD